MTVEVAEPCGVDGHEPLALERREGASVAAVRVAKVGVRDLQGATTDDAFEARVLALARVVEDNDGRGSGGHAGAMGGRSASCLLCPLQGVTAELRPIVRDLHHVAAEASESHDGSEDDDPPGELAVPSNDEPEEQPASELAERRHEGPTRQSRSSRNGDLLGCCSFGGRGESEVGVIAVHAGPYAGANG